jgi:hypothetical protein
MPATPGGKVTSRGRKISSDSRIRQIQQKQREIEKQTKLIKHELDGIQRGTIGNYWVVIRNPHEFTTYRVALERHLQSLRSQQAKLKRTNREVRLALLESNSRKVRSSNRIAARKILRNAEKRGQLTTDEEQRLIRHAQKTLRESLQLLGERPTRRNMVFSLQCLEDFMLVGGEESGCEEGFAALASAVEQRYRQVELGFRKKPTAENLRGLLKAHAEGLLFSHGDAEFPPRPLGLKPPWPDKLHKVEAGDTLSKISEKYYGSPAYWDVIYMENYGVIGDNFRQLREGVVLRVPGAR